MKKNLIFIFFVLVLVISLAGCATATPTSAVKSFYNYINNGEYDKAVSMFSQNAVDMFGINKLGSVVEMQASQVKAKGGVSRFEVTNEKVVGNKAVVSYDIQYGNGQKDSGSINCVKEDGKWKIDISK